jgi:hypothetical protein
MSYGADVGPFPEGHGSSTTSLEDRATSHGINPAQMANNRPALHGDPGDAIRRRAFFTIVERILPEIIEQILMAIRTYEIHRLACKMLLLTHETIRVSFLGL